VNLLVLEQLRTAAIMRRWQQIIPQCAKEITFGDTYVRYLHPTKGHRYVSKKRLGLA
jgi:hypothetical protein